MSHLSRTGSYHRYQSLIPAPAAFPISHNLLSWGHSILSTMDKPNIVAYLKTSCGWSNGVRAVLKKYDLNYEEKDIIKNPAFRWEMEQKSGQPLSPCIEINGTILPDISGEEVEHYLVSNHLVESSSSPTDVPLNAACPPEQHAAQAQGLFFKA
jgi:glutaredoxin